eukprot:m.313779 g.313779  ORF g.313779 m.313779 type:complete len:56 (+) comp436304_c0_seq1:162-329(+)
MALNSLKAILCVSLSTFEKHIAKNLPGIQLITNLIYKRLLRENPQLFFRQIQVWL